MLNYVLAVLFIWSIVGASDASPEDKCPGPFTYHPNAARGPPRWGKVFCSETCGIGRSQSPIDLRLKALPRGITEGPKPEFFEGEFKLEETTENFELSCEEAGSCGFTMFNGVRFDVVNVHFHSPSEHTLGGRRFPLEAHIVHSSEGGTLSVISTLFQFPSYLDQLRVKKRSEFGGNSLLGDILSKMEDGHTELEEDLSVIIGDKGFVHYNGSLTTPPCTEGVTWFVQMEIQTVSPSQVKRFMKIAGRTAMRFGNNRPIQEHNRRTLTAFIR